MSKAFSKASGAGVKNYITPSGVQRLKDELRFLLTRERPAVTRVVAWAASNGDRSENADYQYNKRRLRQIDGRIRFLTKRIDAAHVVDPEAPRAGRAATHVFSGRPCATPTPPEPNGSSASSASTRLIWTATTSAGSRRWRAR
jgi:hypothetical protein